MTKYITPTDYLNYWGENLDNILPNDDMPSGKADRFISQIEDDVDVFLETKCFKKIDAIYPVMNDYQKECYKKALLNQARYKIENGDLANDSGYNPTTGKVINRLELQEIELSSRTIAYLKKAGLYTRKIGASGSFFPWSIW